ncbi:MAG: DUF3857 domain-containing protein [Saprospiraceae bacterium]|nr:DUF3857 domain-containing protein [Saprospiraceae bacterium]
MKKSIFVFLLLTTFSFLPLYAQLYYPATIDEALKEGAHSVIRHEEVFFKVKSISEGTYHFKQVITILNEKSSDHIFRIDYDGDSKVGKIEATLYDAFGQKVRKIKSNEIRDYSSVSSFSIYEDSRYKRLEVKHNSYPYTIELEYEMQVKGIHFVTFNSWVIQGFLQSVEHATYQLEIPSDQGFQYRQSNFDGEPSIKEEKGKKIYRWEVKNLLAKKRVPYGPKVFDILPVLWLSPEEFKYDQYKGSMKTWADYGQFMNQLIEGRTELPDAFVSELKGLVADADTRKEKIDRLYRYLQTNMRYVSVQLGIGGWQPFEASFVSDKKYGDCKALSNFMYAMLKAVDIESYQVLITRGTLNYEVRQDFTNTVFNHMVLHVPAEDYWLECTSSDLPPNYLGSDNINRNVLLITPEGGKVVKTPNLTAEDNQENHKVVMLLKPDGSVEASVKVFASGASHEGYRRAERRLSQEEKNKWLTRISDLPSFTIQDFTIEASKTKPEAEVSYTLQIPRYAARAGKRLFVPLNAFNKWEYVPRVMKTRTQNVFIETSYWDRDEIILDIPEGFQLESVPVEEKRIESSMGHYDVKVFQRGKQLIMNRDFKLEAGEYPASEYHNLRQFFKEISKLDAMKVVLVEKKT